MTTRTDIHRPGAIVPSEYRYCFSYHLATTYGGWPVPSFNVDLIIKLRLEGAKFAFSGGTGKCSVCGANYIYGDVWVHEPTGEHIHIGHDCADKYQMLADRSEFQKQRAAEMLKAEREAKKAAAEKIRNEFMDAHPGLREALTCSHHIIEDIRGRFEKWSNMSDKQVALVLKLAAEANKPAAEQEKNVPAPIAPGRHTFRGTIVSAKLVDGNYGPAYKMTVKVATPDGVWLAYGTLPAAIVPSGALADLRGREVDVTAGLEMGHSDPKPHFVFLKRPVAKLVVVAS